MDHFEPGITGNVQRIFRARYKLDEPGLISHITQRAAGKDPLFLDDRDYMTMLGLLKESSEKFNISYYALCLMQNHLHIQIKPHKKNLVQAMRSIFSRYAAKFNHRYERRGHLFGGPYRQSVCLDNSYLLSASIYIHLNPVRAGLTDNANQYRWSSSSLYCLDTPKESFVDPKPVLQLVHDDQDAARREYKKILQKAQGAEPDNALEHKGAIEKFCVRLAEIFPALFKRLSKKTRADKNLSPSLLELTELESRLQKMTGSRTPSAESRMAKKYIIEQLLARGFKKTEIAERMGISRRSVYYLLNSSTKS